eukprot:2704711-Prymnesium_polylepis.1
MLAIWPIGTPVVYALLLCKARVAIRTGVRSPLSQPTAFLWGDYTTTCYLWEPLEMCRKLAVT